MDDLSGEVCLAFEAGRLKYFAENWKKITSDEVVLDIVQNCRFTIKGRNKPY